jgi:signal transduction histidine kinase
VTNSVQHELLQRYPGATLEISEHGIVISSNALLDRAVGRPLVNSNLAEVLDASSQAKWQMLLQRSEEPVTYELAFEAGETLEVRRFIVAWSKSEPLLWLIEHPRDARMEQLYNELAALNSELSHAQREVARERSRLSRALQEAQTAIRTRDDVLAIVSHDLRNPLNTIRMAAGLLEMNIPEHKKQQHVDVIKRSVDRMTTLISDLLDVSAIEAGRFQIERAPVSIAGLLKEVCVLSETQAAHKRQKLTCEGEPDLPVIAADYNRLVQALMNLIGNAIKFTPEDGEIEVRAGRTDGGVLISVSDTGPGIPRDDVAHVFEKYWHATRRQRGGTGLGLAITKGIVDAHGGRIWVDVERKTGTQISFVIPIGSGKNAPAAG